MRVASRALAVLALLLMVTQLAACGGDSSETVESGVVVKARTDAQFTDGIKSVVALPLGRLEVFLGEPTDRLAPDENRQLADLRAPEGHTFVPITWQYDAGTFGVYAEYAATEDSPVIDLVADGAEYRLIAPATRGEGSESFYVTVRGDAESTELKVDYLGVTQTLDLQTGERETGAAASLYDLPAEAPKARNCAKAATFKVVGIGAATDFKCTVTRALPLPFAAGAWAEDGHRWIAFTVQTALPRFDVLAPDFKSGAGYVGTKVASTFKLGSLEPTKVIEDLTSVRCPGPGGVCSARYHVIFDVSDKTPRRLVTEQTYDTKLGGTWGTPGKAPSDPTLSVLGTIDVAAR